MARLREGDVVIWSAEIPVGSRFLMGDRRVADRRGEERRSGERPEAGGDRRQQERRFGFGGRRAADQPQTSADADSNDNLVVHRRTCVVVSAEVNNRLAETVVVLPVTTDMDEKGKILRPLISASRENGLRADSLVLCEQPVTLPMHALAGPYGRVDAAVIELLRGRLGWVLGIGEA